MNQASLEQRADFHAAPNRGEHGTGAALLFQPGMDLLMGLAAVVIRHRKMLEPPLGGLPNEVQGFEAAVAADGVAVKVVRGGAARRSHLIENSLERMGHLSPHLKLWRRLRPAVGANGHKTELTPWSWPISR